MLRFSIIGSAEPGRNDPSHEHPFNPRVNVDRSREIARALGAELAKRKHGLVVYDADYIEADVVEGYVGQNPQFEGNERPIIVRQPQDGNLVPFKEEATHPALFERRADKTGMWEVSFYRSLSDSDGLILLGGAKSTEIAGQVAIGARIPILALAATGGAASTVWKTIAAGPDLPTVDEHARMAHALSDESVSRWVDSLEAQRRRRFAVESGPILWHAVFAASFFALALGLALASCLIPKLLPGIATAFVIASTLLAGAAGAAIRMVFERRYGAGPLVPPSMAITFALGGMAGAIAGLLYVVAQPGALTFTGDAGLRLVASLVVIGTIAGLTVETIFRKLLGVDVLQTRSIAVGGAARDGTPPRGGP